LDLLVREAQTAQSSPRGQGNSDKIEPGQLPESKELPSDPNDGLRVFFFFVAYFGRMHNFQRSFVHLDARS
jgi:hypothetical protein